MKAQRLKITESGMLTYSDYYCGIKFTDGLSDDPVSPAIASQIGSYIRIEAVDDGVQVGEAVSYGNGKKTKAEVKVALATETPMTTSSDAVVKTESVTKHTRESLEAIADAEGILGLRAVADSYGVKGRGIVELISEILKAQG